MSRTKLVNRGLWACVLLTVLAVHVYSGFGQSVRPFLPGVDRYGSPCPSLGSQGTGRVFHDEQTGIVVQIAGAVVRNESGSAACFRNLGFPVTNEVTHTSTSDTLTVCAPLRIGRRVVSTRVLANLIACFDPNSNNTGTVTATATATGTGTNTNTQTGTEALRL